MKRTSTHPASRRAFLGTIAGAGTALGASLLCPKPAHASGEDGDTQPTPCALLNPIPGGLAPFKPFAIFIHHNPLNPALPLAGINDPSQITDFDGFVGLTHIRGGGTGTNTDTGETTPLAYQADMGFGQGRFIGTDGHQHQGTFAFVWLDVYTGPAGSAVLTEQIHDFNVHIDSNDVFWMVRVPHGSVEVDFDDAKASLKVQHLAVFDDHDIANSLTFGLGLPGGLGFPYPAIAPVAPTRAIVSFDVEWNGLVAEAQIHNTGQNFKGSFLSTGATISWSAEAPGFRFQSEPPDPARNLISVLGHEQNGFFFS